MPERLALPVGLFQAHDVHRAYLAILAPSDGSEVPLASLLLPALVADVVDQLQQLVLQAWAQYTHILLNSVVFIVLTLLRSYAQSLPVAACASAWRLLRMQQGSKVAFEAAKAAGCCGNHWAMLERAQAGVPASGAQAAAAQQWGECSVLPHASGLELCSAGPQEAGLGPGAGASLDAATSSALLAALANGSVAGASACATWDLSASLKR